MFRAVRFLTEIRRAKAVGEFTGIISAPFKLTVDQ